MTARASLVEQLLDLAWSHWAALGVAGSVQAAEVPVDLEALLLLTAELAAEDPRLRDEALDWCSRFHGFASKPRLKQLLREMTYLLRFTRPRQWAATEPSDPIPTVGSTLPTNGV